MKTPPLIAGIPLLFAAGGADAAPRERLLMDSGWRFHLGHAADPAKDFGFGHGAYFAKSGDQQGVLSSRFSDAGWRTVDLPHDWAVELPFVEGRWEQTSHGSKPLGRDYPATSVGWYRRRFTLTEADRGKRLSLEFDGAFRDSQVWLNGHYLGRHESGYTPFRYDITDVAQYGSPNTLVVRLDATQFEGWFYEGAGLYRHVWLTKTSPLHVPQWGTFVTSTVGREKATVTVRTEVANEASEAAKFDVESAIVDPDGKDVATIRTGSSSLAAWGKTSVSQRITIPNPRLWSPDSPALYRMVTVIRKDGQVVDRVETPFGIRTIRFDAKTGFFLNGKLLKIQGTCNHQDHAGLGAALPDAVQDFRIRRLKEMGCNAYRTSHNPPTPELLDACDRLGMLVMDENRLLDSSPDMLDQFRTLVRRDRNHPSVFIWSLGNEENAIQWTEVGARITATMKRILRDLDPTRPATVAMNGGWGQGATAEVDVMGFNYGTIANVHAFHAAHPDLPTTGTETASTLSTRGAYVNDPSKSFMSAYDVNQPGWGHLAEQWWTDYATRPWLTGGFAWTGFDYRGEPTPYGWPAISSQFGILDTCGFFKDNAYYYQAWWTEVPVVHLLPHWNWPGREGQEIDVWCHSNADRVELLLNGKSLGAKDMPRYGHLEWKVPYEPGTLEARGTRDGKTIATHCVETAGAPAKVSLTPDRPALKADGEDVAMVTFSVLDAAGRTVPLADDEVRFEVSDNARILGVGNGNPGSHEPDKFVPLSFSRALESWKRRTVEGSGQMPETAPDFDDAGWDAVTVGQDGEGLKPNETAVYRASVELTDEDIRNGLTTMTVASIDDFGTVFVNGREIARTDDWERSWAFDLSGFLKPGRNAVAIVVRNAANVGGLAGVALVGQTPAPEYRRRVFHGLGQVIIQATRTVGPITLRATAPGLEPATLTIPAAAATPRPFVP